MLIGLLPLFAVSLFAAGAFGLMFLANYGRSEKTGTAVDIEFLPEDSSWVVKVYKGHAGDYEGHVYRNSEFMAKASGFASSDLAIGWGFTYARTH